MSIPAAAAMRAYAYSILPYPPGAPRPESIPTPSNFSNHGSKPGSVGTWPERSSPVVGFRATTALARAPPAEVPTAIRLRERVGGGVVGADVALQRAPCCTHEIGQVDGGRLQPAGASLRAEFERSHAAPPEVRETIERGDPFGCDTLGREICHRQRVAEIIRE